MCGHDVILELPDWILHFSFMSVALGHCFQSQKCVHSCLWSAHPWNSEHCPYSLKFSCLASLQFAHPCLSSMPIGLTQPRWNMKGQELSQTHGSKYQLGHLLAVWPCVSYPASPSPVSSSVPGSTGSSWKGSRAGLPSNVQLYEEEFPVPFWLWALEKSCDLAHMKVLRIKFST